MVVTREMARRVEEGLVRRWWRMRGDRRVRVADRDLVGC